MNEHDLNKIIDTYTHSVAFAPNEVADNTLVASADEAIQPLLRRMLTRHLRPAIASAWALIYAGAWQPALDQLQLLNLADSPIAALAYARIATRNGYHLAAKEYLKFGIHAHRQSGQDINLAKFHGLLGELLLRQRLPEKALQHMQIAYQLTPRGHYSRQMQYSFIAMALARLEQPNLANEHYMRAFYLAVAKNDANGKQHALLRSAALSLFGDDEAMERAIALGQENNVTFSGIVEGYWNLLLLYRHWQQGSVNPEFIDKASRAFAKVAPLEHYYCSAISNSVVPSTKRTDQAATTNAAPRLIFFENENYPAAPDLLDLDALPIADIKNIPPITTVDDLQHMLSRFFI